MYFGVLALFSQLNVAHLDAKFNFQALLVKRFFGLFGNLLIYCPQECGQAF